LRSNQHEYDDDRMRPSRYSAHVIGPRRAAASGLPRRGILHATPFLLLIALLTTILAPASAQAASPLTWSAPVSVDPGQTPSAIACPSTGLCVAVDRAGQVLHTSDPTAPSPAWSKPAGIDPGHTPASLACAPTGLCVTVDESGEQLTSTDPRGGAGTWQGTSIDGTTGLTGVSCPSAALCVAVDQAGNALTSTNPGASNPTWTTRAIDAGNRLQAISCPTESLCVAVDAAGNALASDNPAAASPSWRTRAIHPASQPLIAISCASGEVCVAIDGAGNALASGNPGASTPTWSSTEIDLTGAPASVSCTTSGLCVVLDDNGDALASDNPTAAVPIWSRSTADPGAPMAGVSCLTGLCVAIDTVGRVVRAFIPPPPSPTPAPAVVVSIVRPHPSIAGVPGVGERLRCVSGVPSEAPATLTYVWVRDATVIVGATTSSYLVKAADAKHHLQCRVTATNAAGSATAGSAFVAIPAGGVLAAVGETTVGKMRASAVAVIGVPLSCSSRAPRGCTVALRVTTTRKRSGKPARRVTLTIATATVHLEQGQRRTISLKLGAIGRRLLAREHRLTVKVSVSGTVIGAVKARLATATLVLRAPSAHAQSVHAPSRRTLSGRAH
jgi:hypothetical protein